MPTPHDYIYGERGFDPTLIYKARIEMAEVRVLMPGARPFPFTFFYFNEQGLCIKQATSKPIISFPNDVLPATPQLTKINRLSYENGLCVSEELFDAETNKKLKETTHRYENKLIQSTTTNRFHETADPRTVEEKRYTYDEDNQLTDISVFSYMLGRNTSEIKFYSQNSLVKQKTTLTFFEVEQGPPDQLVEEIAYSYHDHGQLSKATIKTNMGDELTEVFTYRSATERNITKKQRFTSGRVESTTEYTYDQQGLILSWYEQVENMKFTTVYRYKVRSSD
ncbi:MAG: hypothetical protein KDC80_15525 [Saprospiraceae bacterium]|nr:hypothetical protein [Saprospiraceae bacterium]